MGPSTWSTIEVVRAGAVVELRFDRPELRNAVDLDMVTEVHRALGEIADDPTVTVVVLTGNGSTFCPGADLREAGVGTARESAPALPDPVVYRSALLLHEMPQVTVAAVNGACAGPGMAWASACDLRLASADARFSTAFLEAGVAGELGLSWTLTRLVGASTARELCFLPRTMSADELRAIGFLNRVFPADVFRTEVGAVVTELAGRRADALRAMKANFLDAERLPLVDYLDGETSRHHAFFTR